MDNIEEHTIICDCYSHILYLNKYEDEEELYISFFEQGFDGKKLSFREKIKWCWNIIKNGHPYTDMIVLDKTKQSKLIEFLNKCTKE